MKHIVTGLLMSIGGLAGLFLCFVFYSSFHRCAFGDFERGAHAVMIHHKYFGNYGSYGYRQRVFESGKDPQDSLEVLLYSQPKEK